MMTRRRIVDPAARFRRSLSLLLLLAAVLTVAGVTGICAIVGGAARGAGFY